MSYYFIYLFSWESLLGLNQPRYCAGSIYLQWLIVVWHLSDETHACVCVSVVKVTTHMEHANRDRSCMPQGVIYKCQVLDIAHWSHQEITFVLVLIVQEIVSECDLSSIQSRPIIFL